MKQIGKLIKQYFFKKSKFHGNWKIISIILFSLSFLGKFGQKIRIVCWRWNLAFRVIQICLIRWWCSPSLFWNENIVFEKIWFKKSKLFVSDDTWHLIYLTLIRICWIWWACSTFLFWAEYIIFRQIGSVKSKLSQMKFGHHHHICFNNCFPYLQKIIHFSWKTFKHLCL